MWQATFFDNDSADWKFHSSLRQRATLVAPNHCSMVKAIQGNSESGRLTLWACESIPRRSCKSTESFYLQYKLAFSEEATGYMLDKFCNSLRHFWGRSLLHTKSPSSVRQSRHFIANAHTHACFPGRGRWLGQLEWPLQYFISVFHKQALQECQKPAERVKIQIAWGWN